ncbi:MAG: glycine zipper domain-containing protein, partial [Planctomycetaceae bacterium]
MNHTQSGTLGGAGLGAVAGAIVGQAVGAPGAGAAIGAATGAVTGNLVGQAEDIREERDFAWAQADAANAQAVADARALTEGDVVTMVQSGVGDAVIIQAV